MTQASVWTPIKSNCFIFKILHQAVCVASLSNPRIQCQRRLFRSHRNTSLPSERKRWNNCNHMLPNTPNAPPCLTNSLQEDRLEAGDGCLRHTEAGKHMKIVFDVLSGQNEKNPTVFIAPECIIGLFFNF